MEPKVRLEQVRINHIQPKTKIGRDITMANPVMSFDLHDSKRDDLKQVHNLVQCSTCHA